MKEEAFSTAAFSSAHGTCLSDLSQWLIGRYLRDWCHASVAHCTYRQHGLALRVATGGETSSNSLNQLWVATNSCHCCFWITGTLIVTFPFMTLRHGRFCTLDSVSPSLSMILWPLAIWGLQIHFWGFIGQPSLCHKGVVVLIFQATKHLYLPLDNL